MGERRRGRSGGGGEEEKGRGMGAKGGWERGWVGWGGQRGRGR